MSLTINNFSSLIWRNEKGQFHRENGPAFISIHDSIEYYLNDSLHRLDGPAIIKSNGIKFYYIDGTRYSKEEYYAKVKKL